MPLRIALALILLSLSGPAFAHVGHFGELAGHNHWIAGAALGLAGAIALWSASRRRGQRADNTAKQEDEASQADEESSEA